MMNSGKKTNRILKRMLSVLLVIALCSAFSSTPSSSFSKYAFEVYSDVTIGSSDTFSITGIGVITGTPNVGETITAGNLTPSTATATYQWQSSPEADGTYSDIEGATEQTYTLEAEDEGFFIKVTATGYDKYKGEVTSEAFGAIGAPIQTELTAIGPISGALTVNSILTAGELTPYNATATYRWMKASSSDGPYSVISGATTRTYTTVAADCNCYLKVEAKGAGRFTGTVTSDVTGPIMGTALASISDIIGTVTVGSTLTAGTVTPLGATVTYQWQTVDSNGNVADIVSATSSTLLLTSSYTNCFIRVKVTGTNSFSGEIISAATNTKVGTGSTPITDIGSIAGTAQVGMTLTAGAITPTGATVTYQWLKCSTFGGTYSEIQGATSSTYTLTSDDYDYYIKVSATGAGSYRATVTSSYIGAVSAGVLTEISNISGACSVGQTLTAGALTPSGATVSYKWQKSPTPYGSFTDISGETQKTLLLKSTDVGYYFKVTATGTGNFSGSATSTFVGPVYNGSAISLTSIGAIGGTAQIGAQLNAGDISPSGATATYQWQRCLTKDGSYSDISGATSDSYTVTVSDNGYYIKVKATGSGNYTGTVTSPSTGPIASQPITAISDIVGNTAVGKILTAGTVTPIGATVTYQWQRIDSYGVASNIPGATASSYKILSDDSYCYIRVIVTGSGTYSGSITSKPTTNRVSTTSTALTGFGSIAGTVQVGETLIAGALSPVGAIATYQWQKCSTLIGSFANIQGATDSTYTLASEDYGYYIRVVATGSGLYTGTLTSTTIFAVASKAIASIGSIGGTAAAGQTLTAGTLAPSGATVTYQWQKASSAYGSYSNISGATLSTLILSSADVGSYFKLTATGTGGYTGTVTSAFIGPVMSGTPTPISSIAAIGGSPQIGALLTAGEVTPSGATVTYQWQRCLTATGTYADISGATSNSYTATVEDKDCYIRVKAQGSGSYTGTATSAPIGTITAQPLTAISEIIGNAAKGKVLTVGTIQPLGATVTYQWQRSDTGSAGTYTDIPGATASAYTVMGEDSYCYLRVKVSGTGAYIGTVISLPTPTRAGTTSTALAGTPSITGTSQVGETLTAGITAVTPTGATVTYQWQRCSTAIGTFANIPGATNSTYTLTSADSGYYIKLTVTGSGNYTGILTSSYIGPITARAITAIGSIGGTTAVGQTLTAGAVTPIGATVTYQWQKSATSGGTYTNISGATQSTYIIGTGDVGRYFKVIITGTGGYTDSITSAYAGPVFSGSATAITAIGVLSGTVQVGQSLTAGSVSPAGATVTYQWQRSLIANGTYADIPDATMGSYKLTADDYNYFIRVKAIGSGTYTGTVASVPTNNTIAACPLTAISNVIGTTYVGRVVTAGTVTPLGATVTYQWQKGDGTTFTDIAGATSITYVPQSEDTYSYLRVVVTGTGAYTGTATSAKTPARVGYTSVSLTSIGAITGASNKVGVTQSAGVLSPSGATATYQWMRSTSITASTYVNIPGATDSTYIPTTDDIGYYIKVVATGSGAYSGTVTSGYKGKIVA